jgi:hypothetical protein
MMSTLPENSRRRAMNSPTASSRPTVSPAIFGGDFRSTNLDLVLGGLIALGLPLATSWLYTVTGGATASLILYYVVCCVIVVLWRKRTLDYQRPERWPWLLFGLSLLPPLANAALNWGALPNAHAPLWGLLVTALVWAPMNAALEQLSWFYVFDAWRNRWRTGNLRWVGLVAGALLLVTLVALIHILFWSRFLPVATNAPLGFLTPTLNLVLTAAYGALYYRSRSMWPVFIIHYLVDLQLVLIGGYSITPYL